MKMPSTAPLTGVACARCPLRAQPAFVRSSPDEVSFIQSMKVTELALPARAAIVVEDSCTASLYTLFSGWAFRFKTLPDGRRQILNFLLPGDLLGLQSKLFEHSDHGVEALTDVVLCAFARAKIWNVFATHPQLAFDLTWLGAREESLVDDGLLSAGRRTAAERLAALLLQLYRRAEAVGLHRDGGVELPLTQAHLADALGLSQVHVNRTMQALRRAQLLEHRGGTLRLPDIRAMRVLARAVAPALEPRPLI